MKLSKAVDVLIDNLEKDEELFYGWQANIAMSFKDEYSRNNKKYKNLTDIHEISNTAAKNFLNSLVNSKR